MTKIMKRVTLRTEAFAQDVAALLAARPEGVPGNARIVDVDLDITRYTFTGAIAHSTVTFTLEWPDERF